MKRQGIYTVLYERLRSGFGIGLVCYVAGILVYYSLGCLTGMNARYGRSLASLEDDVWPVRHCLYMIGITFTTVGFGDELGTDEVRVYRDPRTGAYYAYNSHDGLVPAPGAPEASIDDLVVEKDFSNLTVPVTVAVTLVGMSVLLYVIGAITAFFVEGGHTELREQMRIAREVARLRGHVIVCGSGPIGLHAVERLAAEGIPAVVVDGDEAALRRLRERFPGLLFVRGDPTDLEVLLEAGLRSARGVVETLPDDNDSLVVIVTAKQENPGARILAVSTGRETAARLRKAGAHEVVATSFLGGMRIASEAIRPAVVRFLDEAMGHEEEHHGYRFLGLRVGEGSPVSGRTLAASRFAEETGLPVLALRRPGERGFAYNPGPDSVLEPGSVLGVLASDPEEARARAFLSGASPGGGNP